VHHGASCELDRVATAEDLDRSWQENVGPACKVEIEIDLGLKSKAFRKDLPTLVTIASEAL
jgi:hypothetical protein